jgi:hypothetical protein
MGRIVKATLVIMRVTVIMPVAMAVIVAMRMSVIMVMTMRVVSMPMTVIMPMSFMRIAMLVCVARRIMRLRLPMLGPSMRVAMVMPVVVRMLAFVFVLMLVRHSEIPFLILPF